MIILYILFGLVLAVGAVILLLLLLPVSVQFAYIGNDLTFKIKCWLMPVYDSNGKGIAAWVIKFIKKRIDKKKASKKDDGEEFFGDDTDVDDLQFGEDANDEIILVNEEAETAEIPDITTDEESAEKVEEKSAEESAKSEISEEKQENDAENHEENYKEKKKEKKIVKFAKKIAKKIIENPLETLEYVVDVFRAGIRPMLKIFKGIKIKRLYIDFVNADADAYNCALNYAYLCTGVYSILACMSSLFTVKLKTVDINPGFGQNESRWDMSAKISFALITPVMAGIWFLITYIFKFFLPNLIQGRKLRKSAERQK